MWKLVFYMTGGTRTSKTFASMSEAIRYGVYKVGVGQVDQCYKIKDNQ